LCGPDAEFLEICQSGQLMNQYMFYVLVYICY